MEEIKVSIIIPVFNTSKYLKQCLDSVINQTLHEIEIICIDDGSTDNSLDILKEYQKRDSRIKVLTQKRKRQGAARNYGISIAEGEYIGFVDSDDWCESDMYEKLYNRAKETDSDITMCAVTLFNDNNNGEFSNASTYANLDVFPKNFFERVFSPQETLDFLMDICVYTPNKIIRRDFINSNNLKFPENVYNYEDGIFLLNIWLSAKRISLIKHFGYYYRMYSDTSTSYSNDFNKLQIFRAFESKKRILQKYDVYKRIRKDFKSCKKKGILLWFNKIKNKRVKALYWLLMFINMPSCLLSALETFFRELNLYLKLVFSQNQRIAFWGASIFLENFISKYHIKNGNIIGIIDKNPAKQGMSIGDYTCYPPEKLKELNPSKVIISIVNFSKSNKMSIKEFLAETEQQNIVLESI
jgi:glycosyltransferase involved in cell wall biosynthesis